MCVNHPFGALVGLLLCLLAVTPSPLPAQDRQAAAANQPDTDEALIRQVLEDQVSAWNRGDIEGFMKTYWNSPELTFSSSGETTRGWQATLDRYRQRYSTREAMGTLRFADMEIRLLGERAAMVLGKWELQNTAGNPHGNWTLVLQKFGAEWLIVHDHTSVVPSQP